LRNTFDGSGAAKQEHVDRTTSAPDG
jgi:hypothetical protein